MAHHEQTIRISTPLGDMIAAAVPAGILRLDFDAVSGVSTRHAERLVDTTRQTEYVPVTDETITFTAAHLELCREELCRYFRGELRSFSVPLAPVGTPFQHLVWNFVRNIPYGETLSYGKLAALLGNPRTARAVGAANARNPVSVIIPCHRLIGNNGQLTGYAGGLDRKQRLLELEKKFQ